MIKTIPSDPDFEITNVSEVISRLSLAQQEYFYLVPTYEDSFSKNNPDRKLLGQRTKLEYDEFVVLIDFQVPDEGTSKIIELEIYDEGTDRFVYVFIP